MKYKKEFGQHFLMDENVCRMIIDRFRQYANVSLPVLEIGPGAGALTQWLVLESFINYKVVEIDQEMADIIFAKFENQIDEIIRMDFLKMVVPFDEKFTVIGNFPYNISSQIMFRILDWRDQVDVLIGMFQKEVAIRIASDAGNKDYGILSVLLQAYYDIDYLFDVPPIAFMPPPKVMSGVISLKRNLGKFDILYHDKFHKMVKASFAMRRKTLRNNLKGYLPEKMLSQSIFDRRAEQLSVADFVALYKEVYES